jgi:hypothetical protein
MLVHLEKFDSKKQARERRRQLKSHQGFNTGIKTKETAIYFNVNPSSIQRARVRLKKKLNLPSGESLFTFLLHF